MVPKDGTSLTLLIFNFRVMTKTTLPSQDGHNTVGVIRDQDGKDMGTKVVEIEHIRNIAHKHVLPLSNSLNFKDLIESLL